MAIIALGGLACGSPSGPTRPLGDPFHGTYVLTHVAGAPLPATAVTLQPGPLIIADTLTFDFFYPAIFAGPRLAVSRVIEDAILGRRNTGFHLQYARTGNEFLIVSACPAEADCVLTMAGGSVQGESLRVDYPSPYASPLTYRRIE